MVLTNEILPLETLESDETNFFDFLNILKKSKEPELFILSSPQVADLTIKMFIPVITLTKLIKTLRSFDVNIKKINFFSPVYINTYCNGNNLEDNIKGVTRYFEISKSYLEINHPEVYRSVDFALIFDHEKQVKEISNLAHSAKSLISKDTLEILKTKSLKHAKESSDESVAAYFLSHFFNYGLATSPTVKPLEFATSKSFFLTPKSEIKFFDLISKEFSKLIHFGILKKTDLHILPLFIKDSFSPPYYPHKNEPSISEILEHNLSRTTIFQSKLNEFAKLELDDSLRIIKQDLNELSIKNMLAIIK